MKDALLQAKAPASHGGMSGSGGGQVDPNAALQKALSSHAGKMLAQDIEGKATDLAIKALLLQGKLQSAGLDEATAAKTAAQYVLSVAQQAMGAGQGKGR